MSSPSDDTNGPEMGSIGTAWGRWGSKTLGLRDPGFDPDPTGNGGGGVLLGRNRWARSAVETLDPPVIV